MATSSRRLFLVLTIAALVGCGGSSPPDEIALRSPETFTWTGGQPIRFAIPPAEWSSSRYQNGGTEGVDFVKKGSGGEQILVVEQFFLGHRDRCARIQQVHDEMNAHVQASFSDAIRKAGMFAQNPINHGERKAIRSIRQLLERAQAAFRNEDRATTQVELQRALKLAASIRYTLEETVDRVLFTAERNTVYPQLEVEPSRTAQVAGEPALRVDFRFDDDGVPFVGRRIYVLKNNRLFELGFQGREANLPLFDAMVASVEFPPGPCKH